MKYEDMPQSAQKSYKLTNTIRKIAMFIGWVAFVGWFVAGLISMIVNKDITFGELLFLCYLYPGILMGLVHSEFGFKGAFQKFSVFGIFALPFIFIYAIFAGGIYLIVDTILFLLKKPLIYAFENKHFIATQDAKAEMVVNALSGMGNGASSSDTAKNDLQNLKEMLDQGLITEEEFNNKKKELLERI